MGRWPQERRMSLVTLALVFVGFPLLAWLAYAWVRGW
jgi:hypothetical protein